MSAETSRSASQAGAADGLLSRAALLLKSLRWMSPLATLRSSAGSEEVLTELREAQGIMRIQLHRKDAAVVMTTAHYEKMVEMKAMYESLIEQVKEEQLTEASSAFDKLYAELTSAQSLRVADSLFAVTADDLRNTYKQDRTGQ